MDKKDIGKKMLKSGGKAMAQTADKQIGNSNDTLGDVANTGKKAVKGAVSTGKMAAKLASQNYLGAIKEFLKNPGGILVTATSVLLVPILIITCVLTVLVNSIWNVIADKPVSSMVDEYIDDLNYAERECFSKACESVSESALNQVREKVDNVDLGDSDLNKNKSKIFKDNDSVQYQLGTAYNQMRRYSSMGNTYVLYEKVLTGQETVFSVLLDNSNGFSVDYNNAGTSTNTLWKRTSWVVDFNNSPSLYEKFIKRVGLKSEDADFEGLQYELDKTNKVLYRFNYDCQKINTSGYTFSMFEMIFNEKYDFDKRNEVNAGEDSSGSRMLSLLEGLEKENESKISPFYIQLVLDNAHSIYDKLGNDAYYLDSEIVDKYNYYVDLFNSKMKKITKELKEEEGEEYNEDDVDEMEYIGQDEKFITKTEEKTREKRKKAFRELIGSEEFYSKLLTSNVAVNVSDVDDSGFSDDRNLKFQDAYATNGSGKTYIKNVKKIVDINISVDICDTDTLAEIFGYKTKNEDGTYTDNTELLDYIVKAGGLDAETLKNKADTKEDDKKEEENKEDNKEDTPDVINTSNDDNTFIWPLDMTAEGVHITSHFGKRDNPLSPGNEENHGAIDIAAPYGTPIAASLPGKVISARHSPSYGNMVEIESNVVIQGKEETVRIIYAHMSNFTVSAGMTITRKENLIGYVGSTGNSTGNHLHFEVRIKQENGKFEKSDPEKLLNEEGIYYLNSSAVNMFDGTLTSFFENCKDAGMATAEILTDAGYTRSSIFWQYNINAYNTIFCSAVTDSSRYKFFVDKDNIAKNDDGSMKIVEFSSADFSAIDFSAGDNATIAANAAKKYNKRYYAVYCYPNTVVQMNLSAYRTNLNFQRMKRSQKIKDWWYGNKVGETEGGLNYMITNLPSEIYSGGDTNAEKRLYEKEKKKALSVFPYSSRDYDCEDFSFLSYCFGNMQYGFEVTNLQVSVPDGNGGEHFLTAADYNSNQYGVYHLNSDIYDMTVTEKMKNADNDSDFQMGQTYLGNVLSEYCYPKDWKEYDADDTSTYPFFIVSISNTLVGKRAGLPIEPPSIYDVFDLDTVENTAYNDGVSVKTWPLVKCYEHTNDVYSLINATVTKVDAANNQITVRDSVGGEIVIKNIVPDEACIAGTKVTANSTKLGTVPDGVEVQCSSVLYNKDGSVESDNPMAAGQMLKTVLCISSRAEMAMVEDSVGKYNIVLGMMSGVIEDLSDTRIKVHCKEDNLYYEYTDFVADEELIDKYRTNKEHGVDTWIYNGTEIGRLYLTTNDKVNHLNVSVYSESNEYRGGYLYYSPANFFSSIGEESTAARKILIQNETGKTLSGIILNRNNEMQLVSKITPDSARGAAVSWISDNPGLVSVDETGKIRASDAHGVAIISCTFADGEDGIGASLRVSVPEKMTDISLTVANGKKQTKDSKPKDSDYTDCILRIVDDTENNVLDINLKDGKATADFNAYTINSSAKRTVDWSIRDRNGNVSTEFATIDKYGTVTAKKPMTSDNTIYVRATSTDKIGEDVYVEVPIRIVQPLERIDITQPSDKNISFILNDGNAHSETVKYSFVPSNATYKDVTIKAVQSSNIFNFADNGNNTVTVNATGEVGTGYLQILSNKYPNIVNSCTVSSSNLIDKVWFTSAPTDVLSKETYKYEIKASYKGKTVDFSNSTMSVEWKVETIKKYNGGYVSGDFTIDDGILRVPSVYGDGTKIRVTAKISGCSYDAGCSGTVSKDVNVNAFPYFYDKKSSWVTNKDDGHYYDSYYVAAEEATNYFEYKYHGQYDLTVGAAFLNTSLTFGHTYKVNYGCDSSGVSIKVIPSDGVKIKISDNEYTFTAQKGLNSGTVTLIYKFVDGNEYTRTFNVSK